MIFALVGVSIKSAQATPLHKIHDKINQQDTDFFLRNVASDAEKLQIFKHCLYKKWIEKEKYCENSKELNFINNNAKYYIYYTLAQKNSHRWRDKNSLKISIKYIDIAHEIFPENISAIVQKSWSMSFLGEQKLVLDLLGRAIKIDIENTKLIGRFNDSYFQRAFQQALLILDRIDRAKIRDNRISFFRGHINEHQGDLPTARKFYSEAAKAPKLRTRAREALARLKRVDQLNKQAVNKMLGLASEGRLDSKPEKQSADGQTKAEKRVAVVIGNAVYSGVPKLNNAVRDATAIARALKDIGFDQVILHSNLSYKKMRSALKEFAEATIGADWSVVYYAGHGIEIDGSNYLVPVDARLKHETHVRFETIGLNDVLSLSQSAKSFRMVILDACRDNPFLKRMKLRNPTRSVNRGLARVEPDASTLVAFAAREGQVAEDGPSGEHSPYVRALLRHMKRPNLDIRRMFGFVRDDVLKLTDRKQEPFTYGSLGGQLFSMNRQ